MEGSDKDLKIKSSTHRVGVSKKRIHQKQNKQHNNNNNRRKQNSNSKNNKQQNPTLSTTHPNHENDDILIDSVNTALRDQKSGEGGSKTDKNKKARKKFSEKKANKQSQQREELDASIRSSPHVILCDSYRKWASEKLPGDKLTIEPWTNEQVTSIHDDEDDDDTEIQGKGKKPRKESSLLKKVKAIIGDDYASATRTGFPSNKNKSKKIKEQQRTIPGIACLMIALTTEGVLSFSRRLYDGRSVPKLFSKHMKLAQHERFLNFECNKHGLLPTGTGTMGRIERLISDGGLTLKYTQALLIDLSRDVKLFNMFDHQLYRNPFFEFLHKHVRERVADGMKIIIVMPSVEKMKTQRVWGSKKHCSTEINSEGNGDDNGNSDDVENDTMEDE